MSGMSRTIECVSRHRQLTIRVVVERAQIPGQRSNSVDGKLVLFKMHQSPQRPFIGASETPDDRVESLHVSRFEYS